MKITKIIGILSSLTLVFLFPTMAQNQEQTVEVEKGVKVTGVIPGSVAQKIELQEGDIITAFAGFNITDTDSLFQVKKYVQVLEKQWQEKGKDKNFWLQNKTEIEKQTGGIFVPPISFLPDGTPLYYLEIMRNGKQQVFEIYSGSWGAYIENWVASGWHFLLLNAVNSKDEEQCIEIISRHKDEMMGYFSSMEQVYISRSGEERKKILLSCANVAKYYENIAINYQVSPWHLKQAKFWKKMINKMLGWEEKEFQLYKKAYEYFEQGFSKKNKKEFLEALELFEKSLKLSKSLLCDSLSQVLLHNIGAIFSQLGQYKKALGYCYQSLAIEKEFGSPSSIASSLNNIGNICIHLSEYENALDYHKESLALQNKLGNRLGIASSLNNIGNIYENLSEYEMALDYHNRSLALKKELGNRSGIASSLNNIGNIYTHLSEYKKALDYYTRSLALQNKLGNRLGIASSLNNIGNIYESLSKYEMALDYLNQSLAIKKELDNSSGIASSLNNIGLIYKNLSEYEMALDYFDQSLTLQKKLSNRSGIASSLNNIGLIYESLSEYEKSLDYFDQSLTLQKKLSNPSGIASSLNNIGNIYESLSEYQKALDYHNRSLTLQKELSNPSGVASSLNNIGNIYENLSEYETALDYHNQSLSLQKELGNPSGIAASLNNIGNIHIHLSRYEKALDYYNQSLALQKKLGNPSGIASSLNNIGSICTNLSEYEMALDYHNQSLALEKELGNPSGIASSLGNIGNIYICLSQYEMALNYHNQSLVIEKELKNNLGISLSLLARAKSYRFLKKSRQALDDYKNALTKWYEISKVAKVARESFLKDKIFFFQEAIDFHILTNNKKEEAWQIFQKYKGYGFLSLMAESKANLEKTIDPKLRRKRNLILAQISDIQKKLSENSKQQEIIDALRNSLEEKEYELRQVIGEIRRVNPAFADLVYPEPATLEQVQSSLQNGEVLLEYFFTTKSKFRSGKAYCFIVDKNSLEVIEIGDTAKINNKIKNFLHTLKDSKNSSMTWTYTEEATELYQLLLDPVLQNRNASKLIIAPDEMLHRLPFSALCLPTEEEGETWKDLSYVADKYEICYVTSATAMVEMSKQKKAKEKKFSLLAMADPVSENENSMVRQSLSKLPGARQEVLAIAKNILPEKSLAEEVSEDFIYQNKDISISFGKEAQESKLFSLPLLYNILHFATHGVIDPENSLRSFLLLAPTDTNKLPPKESNLPLESITDGNLQAREIFHLKDRIQAELVVLSACETGLGMLERGDGVVGFARAWMYAGVNNLVVSLWKVDDISTSRLMESFYQNFFKGKNSGDFLEYLSRAKKQLRYSEDFAAPYYWAPFVFIGK